MKYNIRRAILSDIPHLAVLFNEYRLFYDQESDVELAHTFIAERMTQNEAIIFIAEDQFDNLLGFTQLYPSFSSVSASKIWILNDLFVAENARRSGVAKSLMQAAKIWGIETGATRIVLETSTANETAQRLYQFLGYERSTTAYHYSLTL